MENPKTETTGSYKARVKKENKKIAIIVVIVLFSIEIARTLTDFILGMGAEFITYRDFESLKLLDEFAVETEPPKDPDLKELVPVKSYSKEIEYDGKRFVIRAYEFSTFEDSAKYFKACGEPQPEPWRTSYGRGSGGSFSAEYITLEDGKILHIDCKRYRYLTALTNFLLEKYPEDFSKLKRSFPPSTTSESPTAYFDGLKRKLYCETLSPSDKKAA